MTADSGLTVRRLTRASTCPPYTGNFFNADTIPTSLKNFITLWPIWGFYRGWGEYKEYASQVTFVYVCVCVLDPCVLYTVAVSFTTRREGTQ